MEKTEEKMEQETEAMTEIGFEPLFDWVLVKPDIQTNISGGGLYIPDTAIKHRDVEDGVVMAIGPGRMLDCGTFLATTIEVGDRVVYRMVVATKFTIGEVDYFLMRESLIMAKTTFMRPDPPVVATGHAKMDT